MSRDRVVIRLCALAAAFASLTALSPLSGGSDYQLIIDGESFELDVDHETQVSLSDGRILDLKLVPQTQGIFEGMFFSFKHDTAIVPQRTELRPNTYQTTLATPNGTTVLIQEYNEEDAETINDLVDRILQEMIRGELAAGYDVEEKRVKAELSDGSKLRGKQAITTNGDETWHRWVHTANRDKKSLLIVTIIEESKMPDDQAVLDLLWDSLRVKFDS